ncbi:MAG TPA: amylo-alpha-1,6-glucosidase [Bacteroidota bacterium]
MRILFTIVLVVLLFGCQSSQGPEISRRARVSVDDLGVSLQSPNRGFMFSDKRGGYLLRTGREEASAGLGFAWFVGSQAICRSVRVSIDGNEVLWENFHVTVFPHKVFYVRDADTVIVYNLFVSSPTTHAIGVEVRTASIADLACSQTAESKNTISIASSPNLKNSSHNAPVRARVATFMLVFDTIQRVDADMFFPSLEEYRQRTKDHCDSLLNGVYFAADDENLTKAMRWAQLMADGMLTAGSDISLMTEVPQTQGTDVRSLVESLSSLNLSLGNPPELHNLITSIASYQDVRAHSPTSGRIPSRISGKQTAYESADATSLFVRQMYHYIAASNDTALARSIFPFIQRSIEGPLKNWVDSLGLLTHGAKETWMHTMNEGPRRGNRAIEVQSNWYFHQYIGALFASYLYDSLQAAVWGGGAEQTMNSINETFMDTLNHRMYDHILPNGTPVYESRPNVLSSFDILRSEMSRKEIVEDVMEHLVTLKGVATLSPPLPDASLFDGAVWPALSRDIIQALTRFDREDIAFKITEGLTQSILTEGVVGGLPKVESPSGQSKSASVYLPSITSYSSAMYETYLGVTVDASIPIVSLTPVLPGSLSNVDFTVYVGSHPLHISYADGAQAFRLSVYSPDISLTLDFLCLMRNGDGWKGSEAIKRGEHMLVVMTPSKLSAYREDNEVKIDAATFLDRYSRRNFFDGFRFAPTR